MDQLFIINTEKFHKNKTFWFQDQRTYCELQKWGHTSEKLQDKGFAVEDIKLPAAELNPLT